MSTPAQPERTATVLSSLSIAALLGAMASPSHGLFMAAGCAPGTNHIPAFSTQSTVTAAINLAITQPSRLVTADATGLSQASLGSLGQFSNFVDTEGVFGTFIVTNSIYTGTNAATLGTRLEGLLSRTCDSASVTVDAGGMNAGGITAICNRLARIDAVINLPADKLLEITAAAANGKPISGPGIVAIKATELTGVSDLTSISTGTLCFPPAAPYFTVSPTGRLIIVANRAHGCVIGGQGTVALSGDVSANVALDGISANVSFDGDGTPGISVAAGSDLTLRANQANGKSISGAGVTTISGDIAANTDLTGVSSQLAIAGSVDAAARLTITAQQANGRSISGAGSISISAASSALVANTDLRGIATSGLEFNGSIAAGKTLAINASQQSITVAGEGSVEISGTAGADTIAPAAITASRVMNGGAGNDGIQGGASIDTSVYASGIAQASLGAPGSEFAVTTPADGTDSVRGVELLRFADATVAVVGNGSVWGTLNAALASAPAGAKLYGNLHVDKDTFGDAASLGAVLARVASGSVLTADITGMTDAQIAALNGSIAGFASVSGGSITINRGGSVVAHHIALQAAVNVAQPGDTVVLAAGEFVLAEQLVITKSIAIVGGGSGSTTIRAGFSGGTSDDARALIRAEAGTDLAVSDLAIDGSGFGVREAIRSKGCGSVSSVRFSNIAADGGTDGIAVHATGNMQVYGCSFSSIGRAGALFSGVGCGIGTFDACTYTGKGAASSPEFGVIVLDGAHVSIAASSVAGNLSPSGAAVLVGSSVADLSHVEVFESILSGNSLGIAEAASGSPSTVVVAGSDLSGNGVAIDVSGAADATCNWWGTTDASAIAAAAPGSVRFTPYQASSGGSCTGEGAVVLVGTGRSYSSVSDANDAASDGDRIAAKSQTYADGQVVVDRSGLVFDVAAGAHGFSLSLGAADSVVLAGAGGIDVAGNGNSNTITGNSGANAIDGGGGSDTAVIGGSSGSLTESGSLLHAGSDTLLNIERIAFGDATVIVVGVAGSEIQSLNAALAGGGSERLYGVLAINKNTFQSEAELVSLLGRILQGSSVSVDVLGMNAAQLAAVASHSAALPAISYPPFQVAHGGAALGYFNTLEESLAFASSGDTVRLPAGSFANPITLDRQIELIGAGASQTVFTAAISINAASSGAGERIAVRNASVESISVSGASNIALSDLSVAGSIAFTGSGSPDQSNWPASGTVSIDRVTATGEILFAHYSTLASVAIDGLSAASVRVESLGALGLGNAVTGAIDNGGASVDARGVTFVGASGARDRSSLSELFRIEDSVLHRLESQARGFVRVTSGAVYLSAHSGSFENALSAAAAGDTIHVEDGSSVVLTHEITQDVRFSGTFSLTKDSFPAGADAGAVLASFLSRGAAGATFAVSTTGMSSQQVSAVGANYQAFNGGVSGTFALTSAQSAAEIASLLGGAPIGAITVDATNMSAAQLAAVLGRLDRIADLGITGRLAIGSPIDAATAASLTLKLAGTAGVEIDFLAWGADSVSNALVLIDRIVLVYNLTVTDALDSNGIAQLLARSVDAAAEGRGKARVIATGMSPAKLALIASLHGKISADGITGSLSLPGGADALATADLTNLISLAAISADVRVDATGQLHASLLAVSSLIDRVDSIAGLSLSNAFSAADLRNLLSRADLASASVDATGMDSAEDGKLAAIADNASRIAPNGITGAIAIDQRLSATRIAALLGKASLGTAYTGGATVAVNASGMTATQLGAIADRAIALGANAAAAFDVSGATITAGLSADRMVAILAISLTDSVVIDTTGMSGAQLDIVFAGSPALAQVTGSILVTAATTPAQIQTYLAYAGQGMVLEIDPRGASESLLAPIYANPLMIARTTAGVVHSGDEFTVDVDFSGLPTEAVGLQTRVVYDTTKVEYLSAADLGGDSFPVPVWTLIESGSICFANGVDITGNGSGFTSGNAAKLRFRAKVPFCVAPGVVRLTSHQFTSRITSANATAIPFIAASQTIIGALDNLALTGTSDLTVDVPTDAGSLLGAAYPEPTVTAANSCGPIEVERVITLPNGTVTQTWPSSFPYDGDQNDPSTTRPTVVTWTARDESGAVVRAEHRYTVRPYQVASVDVNLIGGIPATSVFTQNIMLRLDGNDSVLVPVSFTGVDGAVTDARLPIRSAFHCMQAQDIGRTLAAVQPVSMDGRRWSVAGPFNLRGGDANSDNRIDVLDFAVFIADFGQASTPGGRTNFNRDGAVNNGDFGFINLNFLQTGQSCTGGLAGDSPLTSVSVRDLRRMGLGELSSADLNHDGMVDTSDIAFALENGLTHGTGANKRPTAQRDW